MGDSFENVCRACLSSELREMHSLAEFSEFDDYLGNIMHKCCDIEVFINGNGYQITQQIFIIIDQNRRRN